MKRWLFPLAIFILAAAAGHYAVMHWSADFIMSRAISKMATRGGWNAFLHAPPTRAEYQPVVRPSPDLLYSSCAVDLAGGPVEVTAVPIPGHYSSISVFDAHTDVAFVRNDEQMAGQPMRVILALAGQNIPAGADVVRLPSARAIVLQRVLLADPAEAAAVDPIRKQARCQRLGAGG